MQKIFAELEDKKIFFYKINLTTFNEFIAMCTNGGQF